jgi:hypothetical protein
MVDRPAPGIAQQATGILDRCDVCRLIHHDDSLKAVRYCQACGAWLCDACRTRYDMRALAALKQALLDARDALRRVAAVLGKDT